MTGAVVVSAVASGVIIAAVNKNIGGTLLIYKELLVREDLYHIFIGKVLHIPVILRFIW